MIGVAAIAATTITTQLLPAGVGAVSLQQDHEKKNSQVLFDANGEQDGELLLSPRGSGSAYGPSASSFLTATPESQTAYSEVGPMGLHDHAEASSRVLPPGKLFKDRTCANARFWWYHFGFGGGGRGRKTAMAAGQNWTPKRDLAAYEVTHEHTDPRAFHCGNKAKDPKNQDSASLRVSALIDTIYGLTIDRANMPMYHKKAAENLKIFRANALHPITDSSAPPEVRVIMGDSLATAQYLTKYYGEQFAVLNMANARNVGGGVNRGAAAQEENIFRRSDCLLTVDQNQLGPDPAHYNKKTRDLIWGKNGKALLTRPFIILPSAMYCNSKSVSNGRGRVVLVMFGADSSVDEIGTTQVYLDTDHSRVCVKDVEEQRGKYGDPETLGYRWLDSSEVFPFYELRAAAANVWDFNGNVSSACE
eukprot:g14831.t1